MGKLLSLLDNCLLTDAHARRPNRGTSLSCRTSHARSVLEGSPSRELQRTHLSSEVSSNYRDAECLAERWKYEHVNENAKQRWHVRTRHREAPKFLANRKFILGLPLLSSRVSAKPAMQGHFKTGHSR